MIIHMELMCNQTCSFL